MSGKEYEMGETLLEGGLRIVATLLDIWLEWFGRFDTSEQEEDFFYRTARVVVPIASLGMLRVESYENS